MMCLGWKPQLSCYPSQKCGNAGIIFLAAAAAAALASKGKGKRTATAGTAGRKRGKR